MHHYYANGELKSSGNSISEGIGQGRITKNLAEAPVDMSFCLTDQDALPLIYDLMQHEGLYLGRVNRHQCGWRSGDGKGVGAGPYDCDDIMRQRPAVSVKSVEPRIFA